MKWLELQMLGDSVLKQGSAVGVIGVLGLRLQCSHECAHVAVAGLAVGDATVDGVVDVPHAAAMGVWCMAS